ncbi:hypothetical protein [Halanaerobium sp. DL-01]|uniref:hypothetical protein n=2 Tax=unclassified Halanaerobium TaxID=2641197 RepID=UPI000DF2C9C7|nr:hypothetical protein [Halanaerobium sp. DL-01]
MEDAIKDGDFDKFFENTNLPSADTISYALKHADLDDLRQIAVDTIQKARYNKSLNANTIDGLKVVAIDGSNVFSMESERLGKDAHKYEHKDVKSTKYYEKMRTYNLFHLYIYRNLRTFDFKKGTKKTFLRRFYKGLILLNEPLYYPGASSG